MELEELKRVAKELGITQAANMKEKTLIKRLTEVGYVAHLPNPPKEPQVIDKLLVTAYDIKEAKVIDDIIAESKPDVVKASKVIVSMTDQEARILKSLGFKNEWLNSIANQYDFDRFQYMHKFKAFRCYKGNNHLDWISVNDLSTLNIHKEITHTLLTFQPLQKDKQIIKLAWRK